MRAYAEIEYTDNFRYLAELMKEKVPETKIVYLKDVKVTDLRQLYGDLAECIGKVADVDEDASTGGLTGNRWVDIRYDPAKLQYYRHSNNAQPFHNDAAYVPNPPEVAFFYCEKQADNGGHNLFLDATDLIYLANKCYPDVLHWMETYAVRFEKGDRIREQPVLTYDSQGPLLNWIETRVKKPDQFTDEFKRLLELATCTDLCRRILLKPGEAVFFHDERVLHDRNAFHAEKEGDRLLWKGGIRL